MYVDVRGFGAVGDWWDSLTAEVKIGILEWAARTWEAGGGGAWPALEAARAAAEHAIPSSAADRNFRISLHMANSILPLLARPVADGGGFVVGSRCYCPPTAPGGVSQQVDVPTACPAGSGGVGGAPVVEAPAAEIARQVEETMRREAVSSARVDRVPGVRRTGVSPRKPPVGTTGKQEPSSPPPLLVQPGELQPEVPLVSDAENDIFKDAPSVPWYRNKWTWIGAATVVVVGTVAVVVLRRSRGR